MASDINIKMDGSKEKNKDNAYPSNTRANSSEATAVDEKKPKKKITIVVDEDDPCLKQEEDKIGERTFTFPGGDPRFQQQNQTLRCWVMYTDFYRCERILGEGTNACTWFKQVFTSVCPKYWIEHWDKLRVEGKFPWHKHKTQGDFPGDKYGV